MYERSSRDVRPCTGLEVVLDGVASLLVGRRSVLEFIGDEAVASFDCDRFDRRGVEAHLSSTRDRGGAVVEFKEGYRGDLPLNLV